MPVRMKFSTTLGAFGLYTVPTEASTDDAPLTDPLNNLSRIILHPQLRYPGVVAVITGTLSLPAASLSTFGTERRTHVLGAHGQSGKPPLIGKLVGYGAGGVTVPWAGTVCVQCPLVNYAYAGDQRSIAVSRWLSLGVSGGNIVAHEMMRGSAAAGPGAVSLTFEVLIINRDLTSAPPNSGPTRMRINGSSFEFVTPKGTISSDHKYVREGIQGGAGVFPLSGGRTTTVRYNNVVGSSVVKETTFRHSLGAGLYAITADYVIRSATSSHSPDYLPAADVGPLIKHVKA